MATLAAPAQTETDGPYAWARLAASLLVGTVACVGTWSVVVALPAIQAEFLIARSDASLPFSCVMIGFAVGCTLMGRVVDRFGLALSVLASAVLLLLGYVMAAQATSLWQFALAHALFIGTGAATGFGPLMSDLSHWFRRHRALAVTVAASGSYMAGAVWPPIIAHFMATDGWRLTHVGLGIAAFAILAPLALALRRRPSAASLAAAERAAEAAQADLGISPGRLQALLAVAGFSCCMAMSMPQVHLVAYCGDLGYGIAIGTRILSMMLGLGIISRIGSGLVADRIGGGPMLILGSAMQGLALLLYVPFDSLSSLFVVSGLFGLFQGGIVPMYAVLIRQFLPPREAGRRIGLVVTATILGMAVGGFAAGAIFDLTRSYRAAFLHGAAWNLLNLAIVAWLVLRPRRGRRLAAA